MTRDERTNEREPAAGAVLGLDNIALELPVASIGTRVLAVAIDYLALSLILVITAVAVILIASAAGSGEPSGLFFVLVVALLFLVQWGYFALAEILGHGRTLGKWAVGLRTVGREGGSPSAFALLLRNLVRAFDLVVGLPLMALDPSSRRLGDRIAGTVVILERRERREIVLGRVPPSWGAREVALAESYLRRAPELAPEVVSRVGSRILALVERDAPQWLAGVPAEADPAWALRHALEVREEAR